MTPIYGVTGKRLAALLAALALGACAATAETGQNAGMSSNSDAEASAEVIAVSPAELEDQIANGRIRLIDVRTPEEFAQGHLEGATNIPLDSFDPAMIENENGKETVLYCRSGRRSGIAAELLSKHLGQPVRHLSGGILAWDEAQLPMLEKKAACC